MKVDRLKTLRFRLIHVPSVGGCLFVQGNSYGHGMIYGAYELCLLVSWLKWMKIVEGTHTPCYHAINGMVGVILLAYPLLK